MCEDVGSPSENSSDSSTATDAEGRSASDCDRCGSTAETQWVVQAKTPAGKYLGLSDGEVTELCDACMREVAESIGDGDESFQGESTKGGENER